MSAEDARIAEEIEPVNRRDFIDVVVFAALVALCVVDRLWINHWPNATPILAAALFAAFFMRRMWLAVLVPIAILLLTDPVKGMYEPGAMIVNYLAMAAPVLLRPVLRSRPSAAVIGGSSIGAGLGYFLISNFGVFAFTPWYAKSITGLVECYVAALPFLKYTLAGVVGWSIVFFGAWRLATQAWPQLVTARPVVARNGG